MIDIKINRGAFKTLVIWFSDKPQERIKLNFTRRLEQSKQLLNIWTSRSLSLKGKITILKTLVVPQYIHLFKNLYTPVATLNEIDKMFFNFLWNTKPARIKRSTIINNYTEGGLKMPDIYCIHSAHKMLWIKSLVEEGRQKWKTLGNELLSLNKTFLDYKLPVEKIRVAKSNFYQQILDCWFSLKGRKPTSANEIQSEYILYNKFIKRGNACFDTAVLKKKVANPKIKLCDVFEHKWSSSSFRKLYY